MPRHRDVGQIHVAFRRILIPAKHRSDGLAKLGAARFVNANSYNTGDNMGAISAFTRPVIFTLFVGFT